MMQPQILLSTLTLLAAQATLAQTPAPASAPPAAAAASAPRPTPPAAARPPGTPAPFAEVTKDAKRSDGFLPLWTKDEKTWIEVPADQLDQPFFFGASLASGLGERFVLPGLMGRERLVVLRRVGNNVQLIARNQHARAPAGTPLARAVAESYSDSLIGSAPLAAAPHAQNKALLVDAFALLGGDISGLQTNLEAAYRLPYALDRGNSSIERAVTDARGSSFTVRGHFAIPKLPAPPVTAPGAPPPNPAALPSPSQVVPDPRSLFIDVAYTLAPLPAQPMRARRADPRVGYFTTAFVDFGNDNSEGRRSHFIERWRLEKKDAAAAVSEPREPIRVVMDRNIPEKWRGPIREGILEWNKAFERAGFRNAIALEQQPADASWASVEGSRMLAVRWFALEGPGAVAVGPSQSDPRTGEILRGAAIIPENWVRIFRSRVADTEPRVMASAMPLEFGKRFAQCSHAEDMLTQAQFAFELMVERGAIDPNGPEAERYIAQSLKDVTMHEVGHALGLRHNFRASASVTPQQLRDARYTAERGISNSVMDYNALNVPLDGEPVADHHMVTLGAYDYWAIEYGYREIAPENEATELAALVARAEREPALAFATDEDVINAVDPLVNQRDLGNDPLAHVQRQIKLTRELWQHTQKRRLDAADDMTLYRRNLQRGFQMLGQVLPNALKYVGGTYTSRATAGANQALLVPVPAARQREALELLVTQLFDTTSFRFDPRFMSRLAVDQLERSGPNRTQGMDYSLAGAVQTVQRGPLDGLMSESLAQRLADAESKVAEPATLMSYAEVQERLQQAIWAELAPKARAAGQIDSLRRNLQREHLKRLAGGLLRPTPATAADVRAVHRQVALALQTQLRSALASGRWNATARAHLDDSLATLNEALKAPLVKQGV